MIYCIHILSAVVIVLLLILFNVSKKYFKQKELHSYVRWCAVEKENSDEYEERQKSIIDLLYSNSDYKELPQIYRFNGSEFDEIITIVEAYKSKLQRDYLRNKLSYIKPQKDGKVFKYYVTEEEYFSYTLYTYLDQNRLKYDFLGKELTKKQIESHEVWFGTQYTYEITDFAVTVHKLMLAMAVIGCKNHSYKIVSDNDNLKEIIKTKHLKTIRYRP